MSMSGEKDVDLNECLERVRPLWDKEQKPEDPLKTSPLLSRGYSDTLDTYWQEKCRGEPPGDDT